LPFADAHQPDYLKDIYSIQTFRELKYLIRSDLHRWHGRTNIFLLLRELLSNPGFKYTFWMRIAVYLRPRRILCPLYIVTRLIGNHYSVRYGIQIPFGTRIGSGFFIGHFGNIVVSGFSVIGRNCNISNGVTLGQANRGPRKGYPQVGDNVYIGPGAKLVGNVRIGNNVAIGANCVVTKDVPDNAVVVGVPGRVISFVGSKDYVENTDYGHIPGLDPGKGASAS
jgi:serine O-acetyltransferase